MKPSIVVLISGFGSNLLAIINSVKIGVLYANIKAVISNKECRGIEIAKRECIEVDVLSKIKGESRSDYDRRLSKLVVKYSPDIVVLAGWMRILTNNFIKNFPRIINLHPALPNTFVGINCIKKAYTAFKKGEIKYTGVMVHYVIQNVDKGEVISMSKVPIHEEDSYEDLLLRVKGMEKGVLMEGIQRIITSIISEGIDEK